MRDIRVPRAAGTSTVPGPARASEPARQRAVDVFRGLTVIGMLLVNNPGSSTTVFAPLRHSEWNGWTPTDLVFPFFLFVVGITTHLSLGRQAAAGADDVTIRRRILRRAGILLAVGVVLNWYPFYQSGALPGIASPGPLDRLGARLLQLRFLGVLQRIALAYGAAALLARRASARRVVAVAVALLVGYWLVMTCVPVPGAPAARWQLPDVPARTMSAWVDRVTLDWRRWGLGDHRWSWSATYDPEGLLSTLPAVASVLCGILAARWLATPRALADRLNGLFAVGSLAMMVGLAWGWSFPINKPIWSSSYVLFTAGMASVVLATLAWITDVMRWDAWTGPALVYGRNPMLAFAGSELLARVLHSSVKLKAGGRRLGFEEWMTRQLVSLGTEPRVASLLWAVAFVLLWYLILVRLDRRGIYLRV